MMRETKSCTGEDKHIEDEADETRRDAESVGGETLPHELGQLDDAEISREKHTEHGNAGDPDERLAKRDALLYRCHRKCNECDVEDETKVACREAEKIRTTAAHGARVGEKFDHAQV